MCVRIFWFERIAQWIIKWIVIKSYLIRCLHRASQVTVFKHDAQFANGERERESEANSLKGPDVEMSSNLRLCGMLAPGKASKCFLKSVPPRLNKCDAFQAIFFTRRTSSPMFYTMDHGHRYATLHISMPHRQEADVSKNLHRIAFCYSGHLSCWPQSVTGSLKNRVQTTKACQKHTNVYTPIN